GRGAGDRRARPRRDLGAGPLARLPPRHGRPREVRRSDPRARDLMAPEPAPLRHVPVLADEVVAMLAPSAGSRHVDATLGGGGHAERILEASDPDGRLLGLDADGAAIARVRERLAARFGDRLRLRQANFRELAEVAPEEGFEALDGCLFDL